MHIPALHDVIRLPYLEVIWSLQARGLQAAMLCYNLSPLALQ